MKDYKTRLVIEEKELQEKVEKLSIFVEGDVIKLANDFNQGVLKIQLLAMKTYLSCLNERLERL